MGLFALALPTERITASTLIQYDPVPVYHLSRLWLADKKIKGLFGYNRNSLGINPAHKVYIILTNISARIFSRRPFLV